MSFKLSKHVEAELHLRKIPRQFLDDVMAHPQQVVPEPGNKKAYQSQVVVAG